MDTQYQFTTFEDLVSITPYIVKRKLEQLRFLNERNDFHPEPSVYEHIKIVTTRLSQTNDINLILAGLFHDICKFDTVRLNPKNGYPTSPGHDLAAADFVKQFDVAKFIISLGGNLQKVSNICKEHMRIKIIDQMRKHKQDELINSDIYQDLLIFTRADNMLNEFYL